MKKILLGLLMGFSMIANAQTVLNVDNATNIVGTWVEEVMKDDGSVQAAAHYQPLESLEINGYKFEFTTTNTNASSQPAYYYATSTNSNQQKTIRIYSGTSMTITAPEGVVMTNIDFKGSNIGSSANFTVNNGTWTTANNANWKGETNSFTVTANATWRLSELSVTTGVVSGIDNINDDIQTVYYNIYGIKVNNPTSGMYITNEGKKIIIR